MEQQVFDDGTTITYGADGQVQSYTTTDGATFSPNRSIFGQFADTLTRGLNMRLEQALGLLPGAQAAPAASAAPAAPQINAMLLWGALAVGVYFLLRKA